MIEKRKTWDEYFIDTAYHIATRSTCRRKKVGAIIVNPTTKSILATGYNGSLPGSEHCEDSGCYIVNNHCLRTVHAETNAINQAAKNGSTLWQTHIYCTTKPCWNCFKNIIQAGIVSIYYREDYKDESFDLYQDFLKKNPNIILERI